MTNNKSRPALASKVSHRSRYSFKGSAANSNAVLGISAAKFKNAIQLRRKECRIPGERFGKELCAYFLSVNNAK